MMVSKTAKNQVPREGSQLRSMEMHEIRAAEVAAQDGVCPKHAAKRRQRPRIEAMC